MIELDKGHGQSNYTRKTLEGLFRENLDKLHPDFTLQASINKDGNVVFYIHCQGYDSDTLDYVVIGDMLLPIQRNTGEQL